MPGPVEQSPVKRSPRSPRPSGINATDWVLRQQAAALEEHEKRIANHTAIQSWTAITSLAMSVITTVALIFIAYSQYRVSERQVALEYAKSAPQFYAQVEQKFGQEEGLYAPTTLAVRLPVAINLRLVHGDITIKDISIMQDVLILRDGGYSPTLPEHPCLVTFRDWFSLKPDQLQGTASPSVNQLFPSLEFQAADGKPAFLDAGPTRIRVKYDDIFGREHMDLITLSPTGEVTVVKDVQRPQNYESETAYLITLSTRTQPFSVFEITKECQGILTK